MHKYLLTAIFLLFIHCFVWCQNILDTVTYRVKIINLESLVWSESNTYEGTTPYREHMMYPERRRFIDLLVSHAGDSNREVFDSTGTKQLTGFDVRDQYCPPARTIDDHIIIPGCQELDKDIQRIEFNEIWSYNNSGSLQKEIISFSPILTTYDTFGKPAGLKKIFTKKTNWLEFPSQSITGLIKYIVDLRGEEELDQNREKAWRKIITDLVLKDSLIFYEGYGFPKIELGKPEIRVALEELDRVDAIYFYEGWSYDNVGFIQKEILGFSIAIALYGEKKEFLGFKPLFMLFPSESARQKLILEMGE
jgi:hypothetical protein